MEMIFNRIIFVTFQLKIYIVIFEFAIANSWKKVAAKKFLLPFLRILYQKI